ncbi:MAG: P-loop NTPase [Candidatus Aenigmatarchaeota archaeon]
MVYGSGLKIIGISSGKGGVGKTTFSINLSAALYEQGFENILIDGDISNANLSVQLGLQHNSITVQDLVSEKLNPLHAIRIHPSGIRVLPAAISLDKANVDISNIKHHLTPVQETFLMDFPPGVAKNTEDLMNVCDEIIVLTTPEMTSITDALKTIELAKELRRPVLGVVVNRVTGDRYELTTGEVQMMCETHLLGSISDDPKVKRANFECVPYIFRFPFSRVSFETRTIASRVLGRPYTGPKYSRLKAILER